MTLTNATLEKTEQQDERLVGSARLPVTAKPSLFRRMLSKLRAGLRRTQPERRVWQLAVVIIVPGGLVLALLWWFARRRGGSAA